MKSLERLFYTISNKHTPNQKDAEALNEVIKYYNTERKELLSNNTLFAKLFVSHFKDVLIKSEGNYTLAVDSLKSTCRISLDDRLEALVIEANHIFLENHIKHYQKDLDTFEYPKYNSDKMKARLKDIMVNMIEDYSELN